MKALTLWQPWASLIACRAKWYETRSWETKYRGPIAIHAGLAFNNSFPEEFAEAAHSALKNSLPGFSYMHELLRGVIIATAELVNCWHIVYHPGLNVEIAKHIPIGAELDVPRKHKDFERYIVPTEKEMLFGDWTPGRYAWELANVKLLPKPIPAKGKQGLWNWEPPEGFLKGGESE